MSGLHPMTVNSIIMRLEGALESLRKRRPEDAERCLHSVVLELSRQIEPRLPESA